MRTLIHILVGIIGFLLLNIVGYVLSEDYRFFLKKLKYQDEVVYDTTLEVDDSNRIDIIDTTPEKVVETNAIQTSGTGFTFFEDISEKKEVKAESELPSLSPGRKAFLDRFEKYNLFEVLEHPSLFGLTSQYPDPYYEYQGRDITLYIFPTKTYSELKKILSVLEFETPFTLNETNSFGTASFFINLDEAFTDDSVRLVLEHESATFGLKIKKDAYNEIKQILTTLP